MSLLISLPRWVSYNFLFPRVMGRGGLHLGGLIDPGIQYLPSRDFHSWGSPKYEHGEVWEFRILPTCVSYSKAKQITYLSHESSTYFCRNLSYISRNLLEPEDQGSIAEGPLD